MLELFGISTTMSTKLAENGIWGIIGVIMILVGKFWVIPSITKFMESRDSMGKNVVKSLDAILDEFSKSNNEIEQRTAGFQKAILKANADRHSIENKIDILLGEYVGTLDNRLALRTFATIIHNHHLISLCFYNIRVNVNGIHTERDIIISRYKRKSEELCEKNNESLGYYYHNKYPLSNFFPDGGASYFNHLMNALYSIQLASSLESSDAQLADIEEAIDINISRLMTAFKKWLVDKEYTYDIAKNNDNFELAYKNNSGKFEVE